MENSTVTSNIVGLSTTPSQKKEAGHQFWRVWCWTFFSLKKNTDRTWKSLPTRSNLDCNALAIGIEASDEHSVITESQSSNSYIEKEAFAYMAETPEEVFKRFEKQAWVQKEQQEILRV